MHVRDEARRYASTAKEGFGDLAATAVDGVDADGRWSPMINVFQILDSVEIEIGHHGTREYCSLHVCSSHLRL